MLAELAEAEFRLWGISRVKSVRGGWGQLPRIPTISSYTMLLVATIYHSTRLTPDSEDRDRGYDSRLHAVLLEPLSAIQRLLLREKIGTHGHGTASRSNEAERGQMKPNKATERSTSDAALHNTERC